MSDMTEIVLEAFRQEWSSLPPDTREYYIKRFQELTKDKSKAEEIDASRESYVWTETNIKRWFGMHPSTSLDQPFEIKLLDIVHFARAVEGRTERKQ